MGERSGTVSVEREAGPERQPHGPGRHQDAADREQSVERLRRDLGITLWDLGAYKAPDAYRADAVIQDGKDPNHNGRVHGT